MRWPMPAAAMQAAVTTAAIVRATSVAAGGGEGSRRWQRPCCWRRFGGHAAVAAAWDFRPVPSACASTQCRRSIRDAGQVHVAERDRAVAAGGPVGGAAAEEEVEHDVV